MVYISRKIIDATTLYWAYVARINKRSLYQSIKNRILHEVFIGLLNEASLPKLKRK